MSTKITYNGKTTELADGYIATLPCKDYKMETDVVVEAPEGSGVSIAEWNGSIAYNPDAIVIFEKIYYVCIKATTAGSLVNNPSVTPSEWKRLNGAYKGEYNSSATYYLGDIVLSNNNLYQSKIDNPETAPDNDMASRWTLLHEGGGGGEQPQLNAPVISSSGFTVNIDDTNNGNFADGYKVYVGDTLVGTVTAKSIDMSTLTDVSKTFAAKVAAFADKFLDSRMSNILNFVVAEGTQGIEYTLSGTRYAVAGLGTATDTDIILASTIDGIPVNTILMNAFAQTNITSITIPSTIISIVQSAFNGAQSLTAVIGLENTTISHIPNNCFYACTALASISLPDTVKSIGDMAFYNTKALKTIRLGSKITSISETAFFGSGLTDIYIPWAEGAVSGAPWGATGATIHYNSEV